MEGRTIQRCGWWEGEEIGIISKMKLHDRSRWEKKLTKKKFVAQINYSPVQKIKRPIPFLLSFNFAMLPQIDVIIMPCILEIHIHKIFVVSYLNIFFITPQTYT